MARASSDAWRTCSWPPKAQTSTNPRITKVTDLRGLPAPGYCVKTCSNDSRNLRAPFPGRESKTNLTSYSRLKGIGPWTDALYRGLELGEPDVVPVGDYHLPSTVSWALTQDRHATDETMLKLLEPYRGCRFEIIRLIMGANIAAPRRSPRMPQRKPQSLR